MQVKLCGVGGPAYDAAVAARGIFVHEASDTARNAAERLFLALWPEDAVRTALQALVASLRTVDARVIPAGNLHLTLVFLGAVDSARRRCVEQVCDSVRARKMVLALERVRSRAHGGVLWIEPAATPLALDELVDELRRSLGRCEFEAEARPFRAHVTLARAMRRRVAPIAPPPIVWNVRDFCLVKSTLEPSGARYEIQRRWALGR